MTTVGVQPTRDELVTEFSQDSLGEVEKRADSGIELIVIVSSQTFVVAEELGVPVINADQEIVAEIFVGLEFSCLVVPACIRLAVGLTIRTSSRAFISTSNSFIAQSSMDSMRLTRAISFG